MSGGAIWYGEFALLLMGVSASSLPTAAAPTILAKCGESTGQGYLNSPAISGWHDDGVTGGWITFVSEDENHKANVLSHDATGATIDARAEGAVVVIVPKASDAGGFAASVIYPKTGVMETYSVLTLPDGQRRVLWTSNKAHVGPGGQLSKVAAFTAECD
jgi:hypothetical protein